MKLLLVTYLFQTVQQAKGHRLLLQNPFCILQIYFSGDADTFNYCGKHFHKSTTLMFSIQMVDSVFPFQRYTPLSNLTEICMLPCSSN